MGKYIETLISDLTDLVPVLWKNPKLMKAKEGIEASGIGISGIIEAEERLLKFSPLIKKLFPETEDGIIESPLRKISSMKEAMGEHYGRTINGTLYLKCDSHLKIAGSVKARGGIYEVLKHAEELCLENKMLARSDDYAVMAEESFREFFSNYSIAVGSTGNLGLSIGIMSRALGFNTTVHMSRDAKEWKKKLLREKGAQVIEYEDDYSKAVEEGRKQCLNNPKAYFIDDENSIDLFMGYSVSALRLKGQLEAEQIKVDEQHQLYLYLPCGVGGAPGGITFGMKVVFGDNVHCYFVEPTHSPCMLLGLLTEKYNKVHIRDYGIDNVTEADGLAVGSPSKLVSMVAEKLLDGEYTIEDDEMFKLLALLKDSEDISIETSAASGLMGPFMVEGDRNSIHIAWATGGLLLPQDIYSRMYEKGKSLL